MIVQRDAERLAAEEEFVGLAKAMLACIVKLSAMGSSPHGSTTKEAPAAASPPDIPDAPAATGNVIRTDEQVIADLDDAYAAAGSEAQLTERIAANTAEVERCGLEQAAADLAIKHGRRIAKAQAVAAPKTEEQIKMEESYVRAAQSMRRATTLGDLGAAWKAAQADMKAMPDEWRTALMADKDRRKAQLQPEAVQA